MERVRRAAHAGSWYTNNARKLEEELDGWLGEAGLTKSPDVRAVIAPHAGYSYSGRCAAYAFGNIDPTNISISDKDVPEIKVLCSNSNRVPFVLKSIFNWFSYSYYDKKHGPIHKSIEALDRMGMEIIETGDPVAFKQYLQEYENTICGRHPISVFLHMLKHSSTQIKIGFVRYEQSSQCKSMRDSSVSYASAAAKVDASGEEEKKD